MLLAEIYCFKKPGRIKKSIVNENLSQNCSADKDELSYTEEGKPDCAIEKQKDANYEVTYDVTNYFKVSNIFECGRNNTGVSYEISYMATEDSE